MAELGLSEVIHNLVAWNERQGKLTEAELSRYMDACVVYAVSKHPWTDRTGAATGSIDKEVEVSPDDMKGTISHFVDYGEWLETRDDFHGQYKILEAARNHNIQNLWDRIQGAMRRGA